MHIVMEEFSNCRYTLGGCFLFGKDGISMYAKLDKLRADLKKAIMKREEADKKVKYLEAKLKEEESLQIVNDVASYNLSPEQLAQFLQLANSGKLQELLSGQVSMPAPVSMNAIEDKDVEEDLFDAEEDEIDD